MVPPARTPLRAHRLRPVNVPRRVIVELDGRGFPVAVSADGRVGGGAGSNPAIEPPVHPPTRLPVESIGEIWRVDDEWWRHPLHRRYIEVILEGGKHAILYEDELTREWFEQTP